MKCGRITAAIGELAKGLRGKKGPNAEIGFTKILGDRNEP